MSFPKKEKAIIRDAKLPRLRVTKHGTYRKTANKVAPSGPKEYGLLRIVK